MSNKFSFKIIAQIIKKTYNLVIVNNFVMYYHYYDY